MLALSYPSYFSPISQWITWAQYSPLFEVCDNYQKQTYRNRLYLLGANGIQMLTVPVKHTKSGINPKYMYVEIDNSSQWQRNHWMTIKTAYRRSPFFEYYEHPFESFFQKKHEYLLQLNLESTNLISECLQMKMSVETTETTKEYSVDARSLVVAKNNNKTNLESYIQVFSDRHDFHSDLSILDLLFNIGNESFAYLKAQKNNLL